MANLLFTEFSHSLAPHTFPRHSDTSFAHKTKPRQSALSKILPKGNEGLVKIIS